MKKLCLLGLLLSVVAHAAPYEATVSPFSQPPQVDGNMEPGEWDGALAVQGWQHLNHFTLDARGGGTWFGFTDEYLYFAIVSELPPDGTLVTRQQYRDSGDMIWDDGIEIWIDPNAGTRETGRGDLRYYNFHANSAGAILDVRYDPRHAAPDTGWDAKWDMANRLDEELGLWIAEIRVPIEDLGIEPDTLIDRTIGLLVARNYKRHWAQTTWFPHKGAFYSLATYPRIRLTRDAPVVAVQSLGNQLHDGLLDLQATIFNPGPARTAQVKLDIESTTMPELEDRTELDLPAGGTATYRYTVPEGRLHDHGRHNLRLVVSDGAETFLHHALHWTQAPEQRWHVRMGPDPDAAFRQAYYPYLNRIKMQVDTTALDLEPAGRGTVTLTDDQGNVLLQQPLTWETSPREHLLEPPVLADGTYSLKLAIEGHTEALVRTFERKHFPWERNTLGITDEIFAPFEPIRVEGQDVSVVLRRYRLDGLGLWESVQAEGNVSAGPFAELLAGPMRLLADEGAPLAGEGQFARTADHEVVFTGKAQHPAVNIQTRATLEYDGCMRFELTLLPGSEAGKELETLQLEIPLREELMPFWHVSTTSLRWNPIGRTPDGEGIIWDSRDFPDGTWYGNFKPFIWLGAEERGISWFADNDRGWVLDVDTQNPRESAPSLELERREGALILRVHFVQKPIVIEEPRHIEFGLMASPAKPMPEDWRTARIAWMGAQYWGSDHDFAARYPRHGDLSPLDMVKALRLGEPFDVEAFMEEYRQRNFQPDQPLGSRNWSQLRGLLGWTANWARGAGTNEYTNAYWEEFHTTSTLHPETRTFGREWSGKYGFGYGDTGGLVPSYQDFAVWWGAEFIRRGIGLYFDNAFPKQHHDPLTSAAYYLPNGEIQPSAGMWAHRAYLRRIWILHRTEADPRLPVIQMIHMTNTQIPPYLVWSDAILDLEWFYGPEPAQARYPVSLLRAQSLGRPSGNIPLALAFIGQPRDAEERKIAERTRTAALAVHEIAVPSNAFDPVLTAFGYGKDDCEVFNYWDHGYPVEMSDPEAKSILLRREGELLLLVCTWNSEANVITVSLHPDVLPEGPRGAEDEETGEGIALAGHSFPLELNAYDVRYIRIR